MHEWNYYGAIPDGGLYRVGDYIYNWFPQNGDLFIYASPSKNYGSQNQLKVTDAKVRDAIVAEISAKGTKLNKDQARAAAADIEARNKKPAYTAPATTTQDNTTPAPATSLVPTWIYDPNAAFYQQGYFYALVAAGGIAVALNWDAIKGMLGLNESAATPALANPARKNKMKKYSNPRMNRKNRRRNREEEVEEEVEEIDEDEE